jgi:hypothetical protein
MTDTNWTTDIEDILEAVRHNSAILQKIHRKKYLELKHTLKYYRIPVIIFSACNSVLSVGLQPYLNQQTISATTCIISLIVGIIGSVELYLSIQNQMELELSLSKDFYALAINIFRILNLERENRNTDPHAFLDNIYSDYHNLIQKSNLLKSKIDDELIKIPVKYGLSISLPPTPSSTNNESV